MAEEEKNLPEGEEVAEEVAPEKKKKEKPPKAPKKEGDIPLVLMLGGAIGGVVLIIISAALGTIVANKLFPPTEDSVKSTILAAFAKIQAEEAEAKAKEAEEKEAEEKHHSLPGWDDNATLEDSYLFVADAEWYSVDGKITTNVRNSMSTYVSVDVTVNYRVHYKEELTARGFLAAGGGEGEGGGHGGHGAEGGGGGPMTVNTSSELYKKLVAGLAGKLTEFMGSHTEAELQNMRPELSEKLKEELKQTFREFGLIIGKVDVTKFVLARQ